MNEVGLIVTNCEITLYFRTLYLNAKYFYKCLVLK